MVLHTRQPGADSVIGWRPVSMASQAVTQAASAAVVSAAPARDHSHHVSACQTWASGLAAEGAGRVYSPLPLPPFALKNCQCGARSGRRHSTAVQC